MRHRPFRVPPYNEHYDGQYDEKTLLWRRLGAEDKSRNICMLLQGLEVNSVLEVGCGTGAVLAKLKERGVGKRHMGVDLSSPDAHRDGTAAEIDLQVFDGKTLPFEDQAFELVYATHVVEHVPEPRAFLSEMKRVASRYLYVEVPCELHMRTRHSALQTSLNIGHINAYTPESFQLLLETCGLRVVRMKLFDHSMGVHGFGSSRWRAIIKSGLRGGLLALSPTLASRIFTYHFGVLIAVED